MFVFDINKFTVIPVVDLDHANEVADQMDAYIVQSADDLKEFTGYQLLKLFNVTRPADVAEVKKFSDKETGIKRTWAQVKDIALTARPVAKVSAPKKPKPAKQPTERKASRSPGVNLQPRATIYPCRAGTVQALFIDMLSRPEGATFAELRDAQHAHAAKTGKKPWQDVTVKSGLNWDVCCVKGYGVTTDLADPRGHVMRLVYPAGHSAPLAHTVSKGKGA